MSLPFTVDIHLQEGDFVRIRRCGYIALDIWTSQSHLPKRWCYCLHCKRVFSLSWTQKHLKHLKQSIANISVLFKEDKVELYRQDIVSELHLHFERRNVGSRPLESRPTRAPTLQDDEHVDEIVPVDQTADKRQYDDGIHPEEQERLLQPETTAEDFDNDTVPEIEPALDCILKNSFVMSEFVGDKFLRLSESVMERVVADSNEERKNIVKARIISTLARKMSSLLCLTKSQNEQLLQFWKTVMVFVSLDNEAIAKRIRASFNTCVRQCLREEHTKKRTCQRYFEECSFFSISLDTVLVHNEHILSCFARFSFDDNIIQVPIFFEVCHDQTGNGIARLVFNKLLENNVNFGKLVSVCTDGATNMTGRSSGMTAVLKQLIREHCALTGSLFHDFHSVWCLAHRLNLTTKDFIDQKGINVVKAFCDWFSDSRRQTAYKTFLARDATRPRQRGIPQPSDTRWLFYLDVVSAILSQKETVDEFIVGQESFTSFWDSLKQQKGKFGELVERIYIP